MSRETPLVSETMARLLAGKGQETLDQWAATIARAGELLATGEAVAEPAAAEPAYPWELTESCLEAPRHVWCAGAEDYATGAGQGAYFAAGFARDEDEFRRRIALEFGRELAHRARLAKGSVQVPFADFFLSPVMRSTLEQFGRGENPPASMVFFARYAENRS
ncbi:hypothetical protein [Novosphingobium pentaromativorans]|uniref:Uncharacterized protein n=1 Tax=Novosphingobium pentaromativorans US6-1 TaxID=1088721 RepID=G6EKC3_9SPHN|nr:hypothetical protein [Novosphingobium pentaromativorans]AIT82786.1 hypothetical protein JI59_25420 [Novosphingobium pentaromativorans US6-1]EHJ58226.1 hypothetical protein NSU_4794 [Novosphingobium pentaromativorans US6-1]